MSRVVSLGVHILDVLGAPVADGAGPGGRYLLEDVRITAAGTAAGTSVDLAKLGVEAVAVGAIGADEVGDLVLSRLSANGVDTAGIVRKSMGTSATILPIRTDGERFATFHRPGAARHLEEDDVPLGAIADADLLHIGGPDALGAFAGEPLRKVLEYARARAIPTTMDVLSWCDAETLEGLMALLPSVDFFFPNHHQVASMTGASDPADGARALLELGAGCVVVTRGADGSLIVNAEETVELPALDVQVVDTTGCGDAYTAGFILGTLKGWSLRARGLMGAACAALVAGGLGSDAGILDLDSTLDFLSKHAPEDAEELMAG